MEEVYDELIELILSEGKRIAKRAGKIEDIGVKKQWLTEEDLVIERAMKKIVKKHYPDHQFFAEEEHHSYPEGADVWIADPISGTKTFIEGLPHYGIVIAYTNKSVVQFGAVYDPSADELFTCFKGKGAFLNGKKISVSNNDKKVVFNLSKGWKDETSAQDMRTKLQQFDLTINKNSHAVNLCYIACGRYDGGITFGKDSFPMFAGALMIQEAGGRFVNSKGEENIHHSDRVFVGGTNAMYERLHGVLQQVKLPKTGQ